MAYINETNFFIPVERFRNLLREQLVCTGKRKEPPPAQQHKGVNVMYKNGKAERLSDLEHAILLCFNSRLEEDLPQIESDEDALIDVLQECESLTRAEAGYYLKHHDDREE